VILIITNGKQIRNINKQKRLFSLFKLYNILLLLSCEISYDSLGGGVYQNDELYELKRWQKSAKELIERMIIHHFTSWHTYLPTIMYSFPSLIIIIKFTVLR
jgi:hypothetical protein